MRALTGFALLMAAGLACGGDGGTGPTANVNLTGSWAVTISPIAGHGLDCQIQGLTVQFSHQGSDLGGVYTVEDMICNGQHAGPLSGSIVSGTAVNNSLHFHFDTEDFDLHGAVYDQDSARGTYTLQLDVDGTVYTFTGNWTARRK